MRLSQFLVGAGAGTVLCGLAGTIGITPALAQSTPYYITDGDSHVAFEILGGVMVNTFAITSPGTNDPYGLSVRNTIWIDDRQNGGAAEYTLAGVPTGNTSSGGATTFDEILDGTTDGVHNYGSTDASGGGTPGVTIADLDWSNQAFLFPITGTASTPNGITYDSANDHLFVSTFANELLEYTKAGTLLNSFTMSLPNTVASLAYEAATDTLWVAPNSGNTIFQLSTTNGAVLNSLTIPNLPSGTFGNNWGGEMVLSAPPVNAPEPGALALLTSALPLGAALFVRRRRRH